MTKWAYIRTALIMVSSFVSLWSGSLVKHATPSVRPSDLLIGFIFGALGLQFLLGIQAVNKWSAPAWEKPSWNENPFLFRQPLQFFHFAGWLFTISSLISSSLTALKAPQYIWDALMPLSAGVGVLVGIHLSQVLFKKKFTGFR